MSALRMERSCSCAELQILSAAACMICSPKARFSGSLFTCLENHSLPTAFRTVSDLARTPHQQKPLTPAFRPQTMARLTICKPFIISALRTPIKQPAEHFCFCGLHSETGSLAGSVFMQSPRRLRGQHINSCSRVIHSRFRPIKSSLCLRFARQPPTHSHG